MAKRTETLDRVAFQKHSMILQLTNLPVRISRLRSLSDHFERAVSLLAHNVLHSALPESAFKVLQQETSRALAGQLKTPDYLTQRAFAASLFPKDDPSLRQATPSTVSALTLQNVKQYYERVFRPDLTTIVVIGNVTLSQAQPTVVGRRLLCHPALPGPAGEFRARILRFLLVRPWLDASNL